LVARASIGALAWAFTVAVNAQAVARFEVVGDAIPAPLTALPGDPERGRAIVHDRPLSSCVLCHLVPGAPGRIAGDIAPPLAGTGARWSVGQLRLRIVDSSRVNPETPMPPYHRTEGLNRVAAAVRDKPILTAQQVEDVVAWLATLKEPPQ